MADGVQQTVAVKKETTWGVAAGASGAQYLPFNDGGATYNLQKAAYASSNMDPTQQVSDSRHGTRSVNGSHSADLAPGAFELYMAAVLRRDFTASVTTGAQTTISFSDTAPNILRASGSFITDGFRVGMVINVAGNLGGNNGKAVISAMAADGSSITAFRLDETDFVDDTAGDSVTITIAGQQTYTPLSGHTDDSFTVEDSQPDIGVHLQSVGVRVNTMTVDSGPDAMVTVSFELLGKNQLPADSSAYFTNPAAVPEEGTLSGADGLLIVDGLKECKATSFNLQVTGNADQSPGIACKDGMAAKTRGNVQVSGSITVVYEDDSYINRFDEESEIPLTYVFRTDDGEALAFHMPNLKVNSAEISSGTGARIVTVNFESTRYKGADTTMQPTSLVIQDTTLS